MGNGVDRLRNMMPMTIISEPISALRVHDGRCRIDRVCYISAIFERNGNSGVWRDDGRTTLRQSPGEQPAANFRVACWLAGAGSVGPQRRRRRRRGGDFGRHSGGRLDSRSCALRWDEGGRETLVPLAGACAVSFSLRSRGLSRRSGNRSKLNNK